MSRDTYTSAFGGKYEEGPEGRIERRGERVQVVCSLEELAEFKAAAHKDQVSLSHWARRLMLAEVVRAGEAAARLGELKRAHGIKDDEPVKKTLGRPAAPREPVHVPRNVQDVPLVGAAKYKDVPLDLDVRDDFVPSIAGLLEEFGDDDDEDVE